MATLVRELMHSDLTQLDSNATVLEAARCMRDADIGDVLVTEGGKLRGIVTDRDLVVRCMAEQASADAKLGQLCSGDLVTISPDEEIDRAVKLMSDHAIRRLPVVEGDRAVGILSLGDLAIERDRQSALGRISAASPNQ
ncbi:MAG TPA: CBS domain-containing protein [Pseudomonadales bacterium]